MKLQQRIKTIVSLTVDDFHSYGYYINQSDEELKQWLTDELMNVKDIEDEATYKISIMVINMLKSIEIIDIDYIHRVILDNSEAVR